MRQTGRDRTTRLRYVIRLVWDLFRFDPAVVFVTPQDQVDGIVKHAFRHGVLGTVFHSVTRKMSNQS